MPVSVARRMLQLANVQPNETVYDLGSGDGRVLQVAAREFDANGVGIEIEPLRALLSRLTFALSGLSSKAKIQRANFFDVSLANADVVIIYLLPKALTRLAPKLKAELKPGARVVTLTYHFSEWQPSVEDANIRVYLPNKESSTKRHEDK